MTDARALRFSYNHIPEESIDGMATEVGMNQWSAMAPAFYFAPGKWSFGGGVRYELTDLDFSDTTLIDEDTLHALDIPIYIGYENSDALRWMSVINPNISGDYDDIDGDSVYYSVLAGAMYAQNEKLKWLFGGYYSNAFDDDFFVPAVGLHWMINDNSDLFIGGPFVRYSHSLWDSFDLLLGGRFASNRWNTTANYGGTEQERDLRIRAYRLSAALQWNLSKNQALFISAGLDVAREVEIKDNADRSILEQDLDEAPLFEIGYRIRL